MNKPDVNVLNILYKFYGIDFHNKEEFLSKKETKQDGIGLYNEKEELMLVVNGIIPDFLSCKINLVQ